MGDLVIIGAGGFGREVLDVVEALNADASDRGSDTWRVLGFLADGHADHEAIAAYDVSHLGGVDVLDDLAPDVQYVIGIGSPQVRATIDARFRDTRDSPVLVHPSVTHGRAVRFGAGTVVCAGARLTNNISLGRHVHVNLNCTIGHDVALGDHVTLSPLVAVSGNVRADDRAFVGTGATINPGVRISTDAVIGSGAAVLRDVPAGVTAVGVPARPR